MIHSLTTTVTLTEPRDTIGETLLLLLLCRVSTIDRELQNYLTLFKSRRRCRVNWTIPTTLRRTLHATAAITTFLRFPMSPSYFALDLTVVSAYGRQSSSSKSSRFICSHYCFFVCWYLFYNLALAACLSVCNGIRVLSVLFLYITACSLRVCIE